MVEPFDVAVFAFFFPWALWFGYRTATTATLYRSLSGTSPGSPTRLVDGEVTAIEGEIDVDEPPDASDRAVGGADSPIAAYVWRATFPRSGTYVFDFENRALKRGKATFASGIESGEFSVTDGGQAIRLDPGWLVEAHDATKLSGLTVGGVDRSRSFHTYLWDSPYVHLTRDAAEVSLDRMVGIVDKHNFGVDLGDYSIESKAIPDGETLAVRGEVRIDQGNPVIRGTDETPLVISDRGFEGLASELGTRTAKYGFISVILLAVAVQFVLRGISFGILYLPSR